MPLFSKNIDAVFFLVIQFSLLFYVDMNLFIGMKVYVSSSLQQQMALLEKERNFAIRGHFPVRIFGLSLVLKI